MFLFSYYTSFYFVHICNRLLRPKTCLLFYLLTVLLAHHFTYHFYLGFGDNSNNMVVLPVTTVMLGLCTSLYFWIYTSVAFEYARNID